MEALGEVDAVATQQSDRLLVGHLLGHGLDSQAAGHCDDRLHHVLVDPAAGQILDELAVELDVTNR